MAKKVTDIDFVVGILESMKGKSTRLIAQEVVKKLGLRIRNRARSRAEDVNQTAARIVREVTRD